MNDGEYCKQALQSADKSEELEIDQPIVENGNVSKANAGSQSFGNEKEEVQLSKISSHLRSDAFENSAFNRLETSEDIILQATSENFNFESF